MTNYSINYGNVISFGMDCNKQFFTMMRNTVFFKPGFFLTYQNQKIYKQYLGEIHTWGLNKSNLMFVQHIQKIGSCTNMPKYRPNKNLNID